MICITSDVHHMGLKTNEQVYLDYPNESEAKIACEFVELARSYDVKLTLYVTGQTLANEYENFKKAAESDNVEIGGHTYDGIPIGNFSKFYYKLFGICPPSHAKGHGSRSSQKKDIQKMIDIAYKRTGKHINSWRSHGLIQDKNTYPLLLEMGLKYISDEIAKDKFLPEVISPGLISHPLNIMMDHDHLIHAHRDEKFVLDAKKRGYGADDFGNDSYSIDQWGDLVSQQVLQIEEKKGISTVLMHPICMYIADKFKTAEKLFKLFSGCKTIWPADIPEHMIVS